MNQTEISELMSKIILPELYNSIYMVFFATIFSTILGLLLAIVLVITAPKGLMPRSFIHSLLNIVVNGIRSFPFIILIVAIIPFTRLIVGTSIGVNAAIIPLVIAGTAFIARIMESNLQEVDPALIEAAQSFGASNFQIVFKVMIPESLPSAVSGVTIAVIAILGNSAMAGAVGAGGLGAVALTHGYSNFNSVIMYGTVVILIIVVIFIQSFGNILYKRLK